MARPLTAGLLASGAGSALAIPLGYATVGLVLTLRRPAIALGITLPALLLPDGRLRSPRWRVVVGTAVAGPGHVLGGGPAGRAELRRRRDTARTVEAFSARLREQVDLDALSAELRDVVDQTVAPTRTSLWLPPAAGARSSR